MTTDSPVGATECRGLVMRDVAGDEHQGRGHCPGCADAAALREQLAEMELREKQAWDEVHVQSARNQRLVEDLHAGTSNTNRMLVKQRDELESALATAEAIARTNGEARGRAEAEVARLKADHFAMSSDLLGAIAEKSLMCGERDRARAERDELRGLMLKLLDNNEGISVRADRFHDVGAWLASHPAAIPEGTPTDRK